MNMAILPKFIVNPYPSDRTTVGYASEEKEIRALKKMAFVNFTVITTNIIPKNEIQSSSFWLSSSS